MTLEELGAFASENMLLVGGLAILAVFLVVVMWKRRQTQRQIANDPPF